MSADPYGDMTDSEFVEVRSKIGDMAYENPQLALRLVRDMRRERGEPEVREDYVPAGTVFH
jgi:hypothetical protein